MPKRKRDSQWMLASPNHEVSVHTYQQLCLWWEALDAYMRKIYPDDDFLAEDRTYLLQWTHIVFGMMLRKKERILIDHVYIYGAVVYVLVVKYHTDVGDIPHLYSKIRIFLENNVSVLMLLQVELDVLETLGFWLPRYMELYTEYADIFTERKGSLCC